MSHENDSNALCFAMHEKYLQSTRMLAKEGSKKFRDAPHLTEAQYDDLRIRNLGAVFEHTSCEGVYCQNDPKHKTMHFQVL